MPLALKIVKAQAASTGNPKMMIGEIPHAKMRQAHKSAPVAKAKPSASEVIVIAHFLFATSVARMSTLVKAQTTRL